MTASIHSHPLILTLMLLCLAGGAGAQGRRPDAREVVRKMAESYAACKSYQDTGVVETTYHEETEGRIEKMPFKTYFKRPNQFRFEWTDFVSWKAGRTSIIWSNATGVFTFWDPDRYEKDEDLSMGIAGATGVSHGAAHTVPRLLLPTEIGGFALTELKDLSLAGEEVFEGEPCYKITGKHPFGFVYEMWISKRDFLLRKQKDQSSGKDGALKTEQEEIHRNIKINLPIADELFNFKPPIPLSTDKEPPLDTPPSGNEVVTWTEFHSEEGRFKVLLPTKPTTQTLSLETPQGQIVHHGFLAATPGLVCIVDYADIPSLPPDSAQVKELFDTARDEFLKGVEGKLASETAISLDGHAGREVVAHLSVGGKARIRFYLINERFYQLAVMHLQLRLPGEPEGEDPAVKFFDSFKIVGDTKRVARLSKAAPMWHNQSRPRGTPASSG